MQLTQRKTSLLLPSTHHEKDGAAGNFNVANLAGDEREPLGTAGGYMHTYNFLQRMTTLSDTSTCRYVSPLTPTFCTGGIVLKWYALETQQ